MDLRERALARKARGETNREIAAALGIAPSCVSKCTRRKLETGSVPPAQVGGCKRRTLSGECADWLRARIASGPSHFEAWRRSWPSGGSSPMRGQWPELQKTLLPPEQTRPDVVRKRVRWKAHQGEIAPERLVFIDETWVKANMAPLHGWGPRDQRLKAAAPF
eukprot:gene66695-91334_t